MRRLITLLAAVCLLAGCGRGEGAPETSQQWQAPKSVNLPVLMYHHIDDSGGADATISEAGFRRQMDVLRDNGYTPVRLDELLSFADGTGDLPEKPVCITFDDGYMSTYQRAFPILGEYGFPGIVFVIGCSVGHQAYYKDTDYPLTLHFGLEQMDEMASSGRMAVQSHTYDMHQWAPFEDTDAPRTSMLPLEGESEQAYTQALEEDFRLEADVLAEGGVERIDALAFPLGRHTDLTDQVLARLGVRATFTVDESRINTLVQGQADCLFGLGRMNMSDSVTDEALLTYLGQ